MLNKGIFVAGTDTGVGKTYVTCRMLEQYRKQGVNAVGMKPVASGMSRIEGQLVNEDIERVRRASDLSVPQHLVNQYAYSPFIAPHLAAGYAGETISIGPIEQAYRQLEQNTDIVLVEGAGGLMTPLNREQTFVDLVQALRLEVILVVAIRLGCINHALLTQQVLRLSNIPLSGWVANYADDAEEASPDIVDSLKDRLSAPLLGVMPWTKTGAEAQKLNLDLLN